MQSRCHQTVGNSEVTGAILREFVGDAGNLPSKPECGEDAARYYCEPKFGASGEIRTLKHLFLRQAAIPVRARWHLVHRGGFEPPRPTWGDRVTAGPFRPGSRTCANLAEGRRIERPSLITMPRFSGPVADQSAVPSAWRRARESNPLASCESLGLTKTTSRPRCLTVRPTLR